MHILAGNLPATDTCSLWSSFKKGGGTAALDWTAAAIGTHSNRDGGKRLQL